MDGLPLASSPDLALSGRLPPRPSDLTGSYGRGGGEPEHPFLLHPQTARGPGGQTPGPLCWAVPPLGENDP